MVLAGAVGGWAQTNLTWLPAGGGSWATTGNWTSGNIPNAATEVAIFNNAGGGTITYGTSATVGGITFNSSAGAYTISQTGTNKTLTLGTYGIQQNDDSLQTITGNRLRLTLGAASNFTVSGAGGLTISATGGSIATTATNTLTLAGNGTGTGTISSQISGTSGTVTKNGSGTWVLSGNNSYTGGTTVNAGTLRATTSANALGSGASTLTLAGGTLVLANNTGLSFNRNTTVTGNTTITSDRLATGAGVTHTLGTLSIGSQTLTVNRGANATSGTGGVTFGATTTTGNATLDVGANSLLTLGALNDGGSADTLTKSGTGTLTLGAAATTITNGTAVNVTAGTLNSNNATALGTLANITLSAGATVNLGANQTFGALNGAGGTVGLGTRTLTVGSTNNLSGSYAGNITGSGSLIKAGTGSLTLTGATNFTGTTTVNAGTLNIQNNTALGTGTGAVTVASGATLQLQGGITVTGRPLSLTGTLESVSGANMWSGNLTVGSGGTILSSTAGQLLTIGPGDFSGTIGMGTNNLTLGGSGDMLINSFVGNVGDTGGLIKNGTGTVTFYGDANNYTGTTTVNDGKIYLDTLDSNYDQTIRGNLVIGDGTGAAESAIVQFSNAQSAHNKIADTSTVTINSDGLLDLNGRRDIIGALVMTGGKIDTQNIPANTPNPAVQGVLFLSGDVTTNASSQTATINGYQFGLNDQTNSGNVRNFTIADGAAASDLTINSEVVFGGINKLGLGTMTLTNTNSYGGTTTVSAGVLNIQNSGALGAHGSGAIANGTTVNTGAALQMQGSIAVGLERLTLNGTGVANDGALRSLSGTNSWAGAVVLANDSLIKTDSGTLTLNGTITGTNKNLIVGGAGDTYATNAIGTGTGTVEKIDSGTLFLSGNSTYQGVTTVQAGAINISSNDALGSAAAGTTVNTGAQLQLTNNITVGGEALTLNGGGVASSGELRNLSGTNTWGGAVTVASGSRINTDAGALTISGSVAAGTSNLTVGGAANTTISGQVTGAAASMLTKDGAGTLTLSNSTNTFGGDITLSSGTLLMGANNALNNATIDAAINGGTLSLSTYAQSIGSIAGTGEINFGGNGSLTLQSNSLFSGTFTGTGTIIVSSGVTLTLGADFNAAGVTIVLAGGTLALNGSTSTFAGLSLTGNSTIDFASAADSTVTFSTLSLSSYGLAVANWTDVQDLFLVNNDPGNYQTAPLNQVTFAPSGAWVGNDTIWTGDYSGYPHNNEVRPWKPVPEPSTYGAMLMGAGLAFFGYRRWRQQRAAASK